MMNNTNPYGPCDQLTVADKTQIVYSVFIASVIITSVLGNTLVCLAVVLSPRLRSNPTNYLIVSLAISDILFSMFFSTFKLYLILHHNHFCSDIYACRMFIVMDLITVPVSISTLFAIALDRFLCLTRPFQYPEMMTKRRMLYVIGFVWFYSVIWAGLGNFRWGNYYHTGSKKMMKSGEASIQVAPRFHCANYNKYYYVTANFIIYLIPLVIMGFTYLKILHIALTQIRAIQATEVTLQNLQVSDERPKPKKSKSKNPRNKRAHRELKATKTVAIIYGAFAICWLPVCILNLIQGFDKTGIFRDLYSNHRTVFLFVNYTFLDILPLLSSAVNPFIYSISSPQFRTAFKVVLMRLIGRSASLSQSRVTEFDVSKVSMANLQ